MSAQVIGECSRIGCTDEAEWSLSVIDHRRPYFQSFRQLSLCCSCTDWLESQEWAEITEGQKYE